MNPTDKDIEWLKERIIGKIIEISSIGCESSDDEVVNNVNSIGIFTYCENKHYCYPWNSIIGFEFGD
jgi:hypothetical protein